MPSYRQSHYHPFPQITNQDPRNNYFSQVRCSDIFSGGSCPHLSHSGVCVCHRLGGVSLYTDVYLTALPSRSKLKKSIHASRNATLCQTDQQCLANVPAEVCDTWKGFNSSMPIFAGANIKTLFSFISCPPKLVEEQCVFSYLSRECDTSAQRHHCKRPKGRILAPFRDKNVAFTD